ncbi:GntR family transcriptional regulator [Frigidibacter sp. MR17.24]|uniref:GntR family transcriptional regulator n=1 Tax=Frigidibacter sp. MR17.24 TaxID=3127345 RepID=UPI003013051A
MYEQIAARIDTGIWPAGTVLPSETALAQEFRVSVGTIRRALGELTAGGALSRRRKTGTVVTGRTPRHSLRFIYNYFRLHSRSGELQNSTPSVLGITQRLSTPAESDRLALSEPAMIHEIRRLRSVGGRAVMHETVILPMSLVPGFPTTPEAVPQLIYQALWHDYGLKISAIREQVEAELANEDDIALLGLTAPAAVLVLQEVAYDEMAQPILLNDHRACTRDDVYINEIQ